MNNTARRNSTKKVVEDVRKSMMFDMSNISRETMYYTALLEQIALSLAVIADRMGKKR